MAEIIKEITDKDAFEAIFNESYLNKTVFIRINNQNIQAQFLSYQDDVIKLRSENLSADVKQCMLLAKESDTIISTQVALVMQQEKNIFVFEPHRIQYFGAARKEERKEIEELEITDLLSDSLIGYYISTEKKKIDLIQERVETNLSQYFDYVEPYFPLSTKTNIRMKFFQTFGIQPIYIHNINEEPEDENTGRVYGLYRRELYNHDPLMRTKKLISEATVPLLYKAMIPFGYIRCNKSSTLSEKEYSLARRMGVSISELFLKNNILKTSSDKIPVTDVSKSGFGITLKGRTHIKYFKEDSYIYSNLLLPGNKKTPILAIVRNINVMSGGLIKIGCEILNIDALGEVYFDEFIDNMGLDEND